jgi:polyisoprenoid-binding protein YceI
MKITITSWIIMRFFKFLGLLGLYISTNAFAAQASIDVALSPAGSFKSTTADVTGVATVKDGKIQARNIVVNLKNLKSGITLRDDHLKKHLEVNKYPNAVLVIGSGENGKGTGKVIIRGTKKDISGEYKINGTMLEAWFKLKLSDFKITGIEYMGVGVKDDIKITVLIPIQKVTDTAKPPPAPVKKPKR